MALISCPECNARVSSMADSCIHCGYPFSGVSASPTEKRSQTAIPKRQFASRTPNTNTRPTREIEGSVGVPTSALDRNCSGWARLAKIIKWISYVMGSLILAATLFIANTTSSHPELQALSKLWGWIMVAFFLGGAFLISMYWDEERGGVKSFSDFVYWLTGGWACGQLCAIAVALWLNSKYREGGVDVDGVMAAGIGAVMGFLPLVIVAGIAWIARGFRRK